MKKTATDRRWARWEPRGHAIASLKATNKRLASERDELHAALTALCASLRIYHTNGGYECYSREHEAAERASFSGCLRRPARPHRTALSRR
jgi:hypothetical protein